MLTCDQLAHRLQEAGIRVTRARRHIVEVIARQDGHFTSAELLDRVAAEYPQTGRATVFRTIELLLGLGLLERVHSGGERRDAYALCDGRHHHHLVCSVCGEVTHVPGCNIQDAIADLARQTGYAVERHWLEVVGRCPRCAARPGVSGAERLQHVAYPHP